jgi:hypothetical protein
MLFKKSSADEIREVIGSLLITTQGVEHHINQCLRLVIRFRQATTIDEIYALKEPEKKKTLGSLLGELRERVSVEPSFDALLKSFLENRNTFAHRMSFLPGWTLETKAGRRVAMEFLKRYSGELAQVQYIFMAFAREEDIRLDRNIPIPEGSESFFATRDKEYVPLVEGLIATHSTEPNKARSKHSKAKSSGARS